MRGYFSVFFALVILFTSLPVMAFAEEWVERETPTNAILTDVMATPDGTFFAVGGGGTVTYSDDGGMHWHLLPWVGTDDSLMSVDMINDREGYAVSSGGEVFYTDDAWATWPDRSEISERQLTRVSALSSQHAFAVGQAGTVLRTSNGMDWVAASVDTAAYLHDIAWVGYDVWIVGGGRTVIHSPDGGVTWTQTGGGVAADYNVVTFVNDVNGYIGGTDGLLLTTEDGGDTWEEVTPEGLPDNFSIEDLAFMTSGHGMALVDNTLYETRDHGLTWEEKTLHATFGGHTSTNLIALAASGNGDTVAVGQGDDEAAIFRAVREFPDNQLVKRVCDSATDDSCSAVYYIDSTGERHAFSNANVYFSWYDSFDDVIEVSASYLAGFTLGSPVTYKPGVKMVKFVSVPTVYVVAEGGVLRAIPDEETAEALYGADWNMHVDDISDAFFSHYTIGEELESAGDYSPADAEASVDVIEDNLGE